MEKITEQQLLAWQTDEFHGINDLYNYFEQFEPWCWAEIGSEGTRLANLMFGAEIEKDSPFEALINAVAVGAAKGAYASVAAALGISDAKALEIAVAPWYEEQDDLPPPVTFEELLKQVAEESISIKDRKAQRDARAEARLNQDQQPPDTTP